MKCRSIPFDQLPFSALFREYVNGSEQLAGFFGGNPLTDDVIRERAEAFEFPGDRDASADVLARFNRSLGAGRESLEKLERLREPNSLVVVTGQQLTLYGGPLFTIYKTLTTLVYARRWEKMLGRPVIPFFWLADEDHDYEEAAEVGLIREDGYHRLRLDSGRGFPVGRERLGEEWNEFHDAFLSELPVSDFTGENRDLLERHYVRGNTFREGFAGLLLELFGKHGLLLAGSDHPVIKKLVSEPMVRAASHPQELQEALEMQSRCIENAGYPRQAMVQPSNLFYIDPESGRRKLELDQGSWNAGNGRLWSPEELARTVEEHPERFSPNVFLRPMLQDRLLPVLAYVCGPGELSYYAQMKPAYGWAGQSMPLLLPRFSATLLEPSISRVLEKLPLQLEEFQDRIEDLDKRFLERSGDDDFEDLFTDWQNEHDRIVEEAKRRIGNFDPTLVASAEGVGAALRKELEKLHKKVNRSRKRKHQIQIDRIHRIRESLFPAGKLQERQVAFVYFMNRYGMDLWDCLLDSLTDEIPDTHKVIEL